MLSLVSTIFLPPYIFFLVIWLAFVAFLIFVGFASLRRRRLINDTPTSKVRGVFIGEVELKGTAESERGKALTSRLAEIPCVHFCWTIEEQWSRTTTETYSDSSGKTKTRTRTESGWKTVAQDSVESAFYLQDETGTIRIDPHQAEIDSEIVFARECSSSDPLYFAKGPSQEISDSTRRRRFTEKAIPLHHPLYILGRSRVREDIVAAEIAFDSQTTTFLISTRPESEISSNENLTSILLLIFALITSSLGAGFFANVEAVDFGRGCLIGGLVFIGIVFGGWVGFVYNSIVRSEKRVRRAWSNVEVELKRRSELIPQLVRVVERMKTHENETESLLRRLRSQENVSPSGGSGENQVAVGRSLNVAAERYPELRSNANFAKLQAELTRTEERIALAQNYYNDVVETFENRVQVFPDRLVAALIRLPNFQRWAGEFDVSSPSVAFE